MVWYCEHVYYISRNFEGVTAIIKNVKNRNFPNAWVSGKFISYPGIWEISQILWHLRNFQNLKNIPSSNTYRNLGNFPNAWVSGKFPKCLGIREISQVSRHLRNFQNFKNMPSSNCGILEPLILCNKICTLNHYFDEILLQVVLLVWSIIYATWWHCRSG